MNIETFDASELAVQSGAANAHADVWIVMATYKPDPGFLRKQIESIRKQTYVRWRCILSDDASGEDDVRAIQDVLSGDPRFLLKANTERVGSYHNFERGLGLVPATACFVAYADQDDVWHEDKLSVLLESFASADVAAAHSDLALIDHDGRLKHPSCWQTEKRNCRALSFHSLLFRNRVTGCSMMFRAGFLPLLLPFPPQGVHLQFHHDLWTCLIAACFGKIHPVERALVSYRQHGANVVGAISPETAVRKLWRLGGMLKSEPCDGTISEWQWRSDLAGAALRRVKYGARLFPPLRLPRNWFSPAFDLGARVLAITVATWLRRHEAAQGIPVLGKLLYDLRRMKRWTYRGCPALMSRRAGIQSKSR